MTSHSVFEVEGQPLEVFKAPGGLRARAAAKIIWRDGHTSYITAKNVMYSTRVSEGSWFVGNRWDIHDIQLIEDAIALGVLPKVSVSKLKKLKEAEQLQRDRHWSAQRIADHAEKLGLKFTPAQAALIARYAKRPYRGSRHKSAVDVP